MFAFTMNLAAVQPVWRGLALSYTSVIGDLCLSYYIEF
jgi:hypothetical protein